MSIIITILIILAFVAALALIFWAFDKFVTPIPQTVKGAIIFIVVAILTIYAIMHGGLRISF